jgi:hypothetical protein
MKTTSLSSVVLWTSESFNSIRSIVESTVCLSEAIRRADLSWSYNPLLATLTANWSASEVQLWADEFTAKCSDMGLEFTMLAFDECDPAQIVTPSKNHLLDSTLRYLDSELLLHDVAFNSGLAARCVQTIAATGWPTPYCLMLYGSGFFSRTLHVGYVPSTDVYLRELLTGRLDTYYGQGANTEPQTLHDLLKGMTAAGERMGWQTTKL